MFEAFPDPDAQLALASSIAQCDAREGVWAYAVLGEYLPLRPLNPNTNLAQRVQTAATAFMLERVVTPDTPADPGSLFARIFDDGTLASALVESGQLATEENIRATRAELMSVASRLDDPEAEAAKLQLFKEKLDTAQIVATLHDTDIVAVFADEGMYRMLMQNLYTPDRFAADGLARTERVVAVAAAGRDEADLAIIRNAYNQLTIRELERYWDATVLDALDPGIKARLGIA